MDLLIHVGLHKTGTTTVQDHLHRSRECLIKEGILYPSCGLFGSQHALIPGSIIPKHFFLDRVKRSLCTVDYIDKLRNEANSLKPKLVILSSEVFSEIAYKREECLGLIAEISKNFSSCSLLLTTRNASHLALSALKHSARERITPWIQDPLGSYAGAFESVITLQNFWLSSGYTVHTKSIDKDKPENLTDYYYGDIIASYSEDGRKCLNAEGEQSSRRKSDRLNSDKLHAYMYAILFLIGNSNEIHSLAKTPIFSNISKKVVSSELNKRVLSQIGTKHLLGYLEYFRLKAEKNSNNRLGLVGNDEKIKALKLANFPSDSIQILYSIVNEIIQSTG